uniref:Uncharacterized protein n=1 Tax=Arundo donax TaxID=35708 RepID=A0A0A9GZW6_ARUDO
MDGLSRTHCIVLGTSTLKSDPYSVIHYTTPTKVTIHNALQ